MSIQIVKRPMVTALVSMLSMGAASVAMANTVHFEAEAARIQWPFRGTITSPLMIKDDPAASGGSYVMVTAGKNSPSTAPASTSEGVAKYTFSVADTGSYRIWARVSVPTSADDSFCVLMAIGDAPPATTSKTTAWVNWNGMTLGSAYHWVQVKPSGGSPSAFNLVNEGVNELQVAYREDGAKIDAFYITNDTAFNPSAPLTGAPLQPIMQPSAQGGGKVKISWSAVPGATSYTLERGPGGCSFNEATQCCEPESPYVVIATGLTRHTFTETDGGQYRVTAVAPTGSSFHPVSQGPDNCFPGDPSVGDGFAGSFYWRAQIPVGSVTPPMRLTGGGVGAPAGTNSTSAPPAHGRMRMDFELAAPATMRMWAEITAPNTSQDSFWVRWDDGAWINWNNLKDFCSTLYDSSKSGSPIVAQLLPAGSHRIEWAYREGGALLYDNIIINEHSPDQGEQCSD